MAKFTRTLLFAFVFVSLSFPVISLAQDKTASSLTNAEYSQIMLEKLNALNTSPALLKTGVPNRAMNNKTMLFYEAKKNFNRLTQEAQAQFKKVMARPTGLSSTYLETTKNFFKFYYTTSGTNAVDTAGLKANSVPTYVKNMADAFVRTLTVYDSLGFARPPIASSDGGRYCVYLSNSAAGDGVYGYSEPETVIGDNPNTSGVTETQAYSSYMCMRNNYSGFGSTDALLQIAMEVTTAHEFNHAIQFGYAYDNFTGFPMEMCATWGEDIVFPKDDDNWQYLTDIFTTPYISIDYDDDLDGTTIASYHWYAAWILERYLTDRFGGDFTKKFYQNVVTQYWSTAMNNLLVSNGSTLKDAIKDYNVAIALLTSSNTAPMSTYRFNRGDDYRTASNTKNSYGPFVVTYAGTVNYSGTKTSYSSTSKLYRASANFIKIVPTSNFSITAAPTSTNANFSARLLKLDSYTNPTKLEVVEPTTSGSNLTFNVADQSSWGNYVLVVYNTLYATSSSRTITSISYTVTVDAATRSNIVALTSPVGGEAWLAGSTQNITWTSTGVTNVKLEYSSDNGSTWSTISASTAASAGTYAWTTPNTVSTQYKVRISDASDATSVATSGSFSILTAGFTLTSPVGGESWVKSSTHNITWSSVGVTNAKLEYSLDGGSTFTTIAASVAASTKTYSWTLPSTTSTTAVVKISDASNSSTSTLSPVFSITAAPTTVTVLTETFAKATAGSIGSASSTDIGTAGTLDTYTDVAGWTGSKVYQAGGVVKIGSSGAMGYIVTPSLDLSSNAGAGTIKFDIRSYGANDVKTLTLALSTDGGSNFTTVTTFTPDTNLTAKTFAYTGGTSTSKFKITANIASGNRFYLDNVVVVAGGTLTAVEEPATKVVPANFALEQNYPNPFNPSTRIQFSVANDDHITLNVYNVTGQLVSSLINERLTAGSYSVMFDASSLPSGVYYYRLTSSHANVAKKMLLLK
jgi:hypothetical protein